MGKRTGKTRMPVQSKFVGYKKILFWMVDLLESNAFIRTGIKCFAMTLIMSLLKSKRLSRLSFRVRSLPAELLDGISRKIAGNTQIDIHRTVFVRKESNVDLNLVNFQWVSVDGDRTKKKVFPCQILVIPGSELVTFAESTKLFLEDNSTHVFYMTPSGLHNLVGKSGGSSGVHRRKSVFKIRPLIKNSNYEKFSLSIYPAKSARLSKLSGCGKTLNPKKLDEYLRDYFQETKYIAEGDILTVRGSNEMDPPICVQVVSIETKEDEIVVKDLVLYSVSTNSTSVYLQEKETNAYRPSCTHQLFSCGEESHVVPVCVPFLQPYLDSLTGWLQSFSSLRSSLFQQTVGGKELDCRERSHELWPSCLLTGSVGSGKYTLGKTLALQCGLNFYCVNLVSLIGDTSAFTIAKLAAVVHKARSYSPCVVFIKNIHFLGKDKEGQEDKRVTLAFLDMLNEINSLYGKATDSEVYFIGETSKGEDILPAVSDCFIFKVNIDPLKNTDGIVQYFKWISLRHHLIQFDFDVEKWAVSNNVKTVLKYLGDLRALLSISVRLAYNEDLHKSFESCEVGNVVLGTNALNDHLNPGKAFVVSQRHVHAALEQLEATERTSVGSPKVPVVTWDDVGGLAETKRELVNSVQLPLRFPHLFKSGIKRSGILLYGPPGTGKTLLAKAVASEFKINFFSVKGPELLNMYVGQSEQNVREVFDRARDCSPCVLFFDELDSLAPNRGRSGDSGGVMDRVVSQILAEMDGTHSSPDVFIIGATNRPDLIDPALLRPGRFDKLIYVGISSDDGAVGSILKALTRKFNLSPDVDMEDVAKELPKGMSGADLYSFCSDSYMTAVTRRISLLESGESEDQESPVVVERRDFNDALRRITPSLSKQELDKYQQLKSLMR